MDLKYCVMTALSAAIVVTDSVATASGRVCKTSTNWVPVVVRRLDLDWDWDNCVCLAWLAAPECKVQREEAVSKSSSTSVESS